MHVCNSCVVRAVFTEIIASLEARDKGEPYQLRWLKSKRVCCVPSCRSVDISSCI